MTYGSICQFWLLPHWPCWYEQAAVGVIVGTEGFEMRSSPDRRRCHEAREVSRQPLVALAVTSQGVGLCRDIRVLRSVDLASAGVAAEPMSCRFER